VKREEELPTWCQENWVDDFMDYSCIHGGVYQVLNAFRFPSIQQRQF
jgi:hypothetical protein